MAVVPCNRSDMNTMVLHLSLDIHYLVHMAMVHTAYVLVVDRLIK